MSNFLSNLAARSLHQADAIRPRPGSRFEMSPPQALESPRREVSPKQSAEQPEEPDGSFEVNSFPEATEAGRAREADWEDHKDTAPRPTAELQGQPPASDPVQLASGPHLPPAMPLPGRPARPQGVSDEGEDESKAQAPLPAKGAEASPPVSVQPSKPLFSQSGTTSSAMIDRLSRAAGPRQSGPSPQRTPSGQPKESSQPVRSLNSGESRSHRQSSSWQEQLPKPRPEDARRQADPEVRTTETPFSVFDSSVRPLGPQDFVASRSRVPVQPRPESAPTPTIRVRIGSVEVHAVKDPSPPPKAATSPAPSMSLDDYLKRFSAEQP